MRCYGKRQGGFKRRGGIKGREIKRLVFQKNESKSLSRILGEMKQELDVLTAALNAQQALEREEKKGSNDDIQNRTAATFIQSY